MKRTRDEIERFWSNVDMRSVASCWHWKLSLDGRGYGQFRLNGGSSRAHRQAFFYHHGILPDGLDICHECDNKKCCNPVHLYPGTRKQNTQDASAPGLLGFGNRNGSRTHPERLWRGEKAVGAKLTAAAVADIRSRPISEVRDLAIKYGVTPWAVYSARRGRTWAHVPKDGPDAEWQRR